MGTVHTVAVHFRYDSYMRRLANEAVQRRFTKRLSGLWNLSYSSRLVRLSLVSLHCRRIKTDLIMCYQISNNHTCLNPDDFFTRSTIDFTRGNAMKLAKPRILCDRHGNCFLFV